MPPREPGKKKDGAARRRKQLVIKERNISSDEFMAASIGDVEWLDQSLRDGRNPSSFDKNGLAPIHLAALHGRLSCLKLLIEKYDVDINLSSSTDWTPLHLCLNRESGSRVGPCIKYLLANDADVDSCNDDNVTPAHQAASEGLLDSLQKLIDHKATLSVRDIRGHLPIDLARLWGHRKCARLIRTEMWQREKEERVEGLKQLQAVKAYYSELQKDAVHQLRNEQEFYGGVAFGNWLAEKHLPENLKHNSTFPRERYPEESMDGLSKRLRISGGLDDCAQRMENATLRSEKRIASTPTKPSMVGTSTTSKQEKRGASILVQEKSDSRRAAQKADIQPAAPAEEASGRVKARGKSEQAGRTGQVEPSTDDIRVKKAGAAKSAMTPDSMATESLQGYVPFSPLYEVPKQEKARWKAPWNFSTNLERDPVTDIRRKDMVGLSIHPDDESTKVFSKKANLLVQLDMTKGAKIKMTLPGGSIEEAKINMPKLPTHLIYDVLSGISSDRIRIPQEFKAVHVYDLKKRRQPHLKPKDEVGMHLSVFGDARILRKANSDQTSTTTAGSPLSTLSSSHETTLPIIHDHSFNRMLDTWQRINPPKAFLS